MKDNSCVPYTCPAIDEAQAIIEHCEMPEYDRYLVLDLLEDLRKDNLQLREWGNSLFEENEKLKNGTI